LSWALVNGELTTLEDARVPATDVGFLRGWTVFETLRVVNRSIPLLDEHLDRLRGSSTAALIGFPANLEEECQRLAALTTEESRIRITLSGSGVRILACESIPLNRRGAPVRCVTGPFVADPFLDGSVKHGSRASWVIAVLKAGVDDVLLVDQDGRFTEGTTCGILAVHQGTLFTAAHDQRILESTTVRDALQVASSLEVPIVRQGALSGDNLEGLYIASATRGLAPVVELDGRALSGWEPIGRKIAAGMP
jgi:branched-subunit amino acid aminotransferase/4-amino-4-deoxychorismate lyase